MKPLANFINESNTVDLYHPISNEDIKRSIKKLDPSEWSKIDTSKVTDMANLFYNMKGKFGDISNWNVSNVESMISMFENSSFNGDISNWDVSNVKYMQFMFAGSKFNQDISDWDVSSVVDMQYMFNESPFNINISNWNISNVEIMDGMFENSNFNQDISDWDVSNIDTSMIDMFNNCPLEKNPPKWYKNK